METIIIQLVLLIVGCLVVMSICASILWDHYRELYRRNHKKNESKK